MERKPTYEELEAEVIALRAQVKELLAEVRSLRAEVARLKGEPPASTPSSQIPPYRKPKRQKSGRGPGRREGHVGCTRERPVEAEAQENHAASQCLHCQTALEDVRTREQIVEQVVPGHVCRVRHVWHEGYCPRCDQRRELRPGEVLRGACLETPLYLWAAQLKAGYGLSYGKIQALLRDFWGVTISAGGLSQGLTRIGACFAQEVEHIQQALRRSAVVNADETGLRVAGASQWLWVFMSEALTLARVEASRGQDVVLKTLGPDFAGVLGCDFYAAYNALPCPKQRCLVHLLRAVREALQEYEHQPGRKPQFLLDLKAWTKAVLELERQRGHISECTFAQRRDLLEQQLQQLLYSRVTNADGERLRLRLWRHHEELLTFLYHHGVDGSNNQVERAIRPLVTHRRMNGGHRSPRGANALATILSVYRSCQQQGRDFIRTGMDIVTRHLHGLPPGVLVPDS